jgi:hypothetical protein
MSVNLSPIGNGFQFFTTTGLPLAGGYIYTYQAGSTTGLSTYTDPSALYPNTNPIQLGTDGRPPQEIWLLAGYNYKFVLTDSLGNTIQTYDNLYGIIGVASSGGTTIPSGLISLWSGSIGSIPMGWLLCDGTNGTPNLKDKFIVGAGASYSVGATGGSTDAVVVSHTHTATSVVTDPSHNHGVYGQSIYNVGTQPNTIPLADYTKSSTINNTGNATTGITVATTNQSTGVSGTNANLPPYYALAYIMKS